MAKPSSIDVKFLEHIIDAYGYCSTDQDAEFLRTIIQNTRYRLSKNNDPDWLYLKTKLPLFDSFDNIEKVESRHHDLIKKSSYLGYAPAQYQLGCRLYEKGNFEEAVKLYRLSADQGYPAAQYCYGIDRFNGVGVIQDKDEGLGYIKLSAGRLYDLAIEFLIQHYKQDNSEEGIRELQLYRNMWRWMGY